MKKNFFIFAFSLLALLSCQKKQPPAIVTIVSPGRTITLPLAGLQTQLKPVTITIKNPVYGTPAPVKMYDAFPLADLLKLVDAKTPKGILVSALDDYTSAIDFTQLPIEQAYLAFRERGTYQNVWEEIPKKKVSPGPFWLVWTNDAVPTVYWPYQIHKIEVTKGSH